MFKFITLLFFIASMAQAESLRWAADTESGAPYVFFDAKSLAMTGYEFDLVQALAKKINREPTFVQNAWDGLILGLNNNLYDMAINGLEITEDRKKSVYFSEPYYATYVSIITKQGDTRFKKLSDLPGFKVGTLGGALSERILRSEEGVQVVTYDSEALAHQDLFLGRVDAIFLDAPIAKYYSEVDKRFQVVPTAIGSMTYGIAISKNNPELLKRVNKALSELIESGELREIYEKWGLWNAATASLFGDMTPNRFKPTEYEKYKSHLNSDRSWKDKLEIYQKTWPLFLKAAGQTIKISFLAMIVAVGLGLILVTLRLYGPNPFKVLTTIFVELIRGTPLLLQLFFIFYALPGFGIEIPALWAAVMALGINYSVQESEIYRSGLTNIHKNQIEAAKMLGLNSWQTFWSIQVPQAVKFCLGPMTTDFIALIKDSSLVSVITLVELTKTYSLLSSTYYEYIGFAFVTAALYMLIGMPLVLLSRKLERGLVK
jgi:polar amino acid transport system substrate-binding protein